MAGFGQVKLLLDQSIGAWKQRTGREPNLAMHGATFGWTDKAQLLASEAFGKRLIPEDKVGNGKGDQTDLVLALQTGSPPFARMPSGGPFMSEQDIQEIIEWIDAGCPD